MGRKARVFVSTILAGLTIIYTGCSSKSNDENSFEELNSSEVNSSIITEKHFMQDPSRVANATQTVYLAIEHPNMLDKHMSSVDSGEKGCDTIKYYIDDSLKEVEVGDDMDINVTFYKDDVAVAKISKGEKATIDKAGEYVLEVCHSSHGYKDMHLPVFINTKLGENSSQSDSNQSLSMKLSKVVGQSGGQTISFNNDSNGQTINDLNFTRTDLKNVNWTGCNIQNNQFDHTNFDINTNFKDSTFTNNTFNGVTFFPQTLHGIPQFTNNLVQNAVLIAPTFIYKKDQYDAASTDLTDTTFENSHIFSPIFGATVSLEVYVKPPWYDVIWNDLKDVAEAATTAKFWENVGEAAGIGLAMAGLAILTDGAADAAAGPALADALADSAADMVEDVASDAADDVADELPATGEGLSDLKQYDDVNFDMMEDGDAGSDVTDYDTVDEFDLGSQWDQYDEIEEEVPDSADAENICDSSYVNQAIIASKTAMAGIGFGVSYLQHLQSGSPTTGEFFEKNALVKSIGAWAGYQWDKSQCDEYDKLNNRNLVAGREVDPTNLLKQLAKGTAVNLGIDAIAAFAKDVQSTNSTDENLKTAFAGLNNPSNDITAITTAFSEMLIDNNVTNYFTKIKRHYLGSEISKVTVDSTETNLTSGPGKMQQMSLSMQNKILDQLQTGGTNSEKYMAIMTNVDFKNCVMTTPQFGDYSSFNFEFADMSNSMIALPSNGTLPPPIFLNNSNFSTGLTLYGGTYDLGPIVSDNWFDPSLNGTGATYYNAVFNNVVYLDLNNSTFVNTQINMNANYAFGMQITNSKILNNSEITVSNGGNQNLVFTDNFIGNSTLSFAQNTTADFTGSTFQNLNKIESSIQNWSYSSLSCEDIMNVGGVDNFFAQTTDVDLEGVHFEYSDSCDLSGLIDRVKAGVINNTKNLSIDYNITGIKNVYSLNDRLTYDIIIPGMIVDGTNIDGSDSDTGLDLSNKDLRDINFSNLYFIDVNLAGVNFSGATFTNVTFYQPDTEGLNLPMEDVNFSNTIFNNVKFYNEISNSDFSYAIFENSPFILESDPLSSELGTTKISNSIWNGVTGANLCTYITYGTFGTSLIGANLSGCDMTLDGANDYSNWNLIDANLTNARLSYVDFTNANLTGSDLSDANLTGTTFSETILTNVNWKGAIGVTTQLCNILSTHPDALGKTLIGADLTQCNIDNFDFTGWDLHDANFTNVNVTNINFTNANLKGVVWKNAAGICDVINNYKDQLGRSMIGANLSQCNIDNFDFTGWDLRDVNFTNLNIQDANFTDANLQGAIVAGINFADTITLPTQKDSLKNVNWQGVDSASICPIIINHADLLGKTMIGANLTYCMENESSFPSSLNGWNLSYSTLSDGFVGDYSCANLTQATELYEDGSGGFIYGSTLPGGLVICDQYSTNGTCNISANGTCQ